MAKIQKGVLILHLSDLHFGKYHYFNDYDQGLDYWIDEFKEILDKRAIHPRLNCDNRRYNFNRK